MQRLRLAALALLRRLDQPVVRLNRPGLCLALAALAIYGAFIAWNFAPVASGADSGGYYNSAKLLLEGKLTTSMRSIPEYPTTNRWLYTPLGFTPIAGEGVLAPSYPIGLPLHYAAASAVLGWFWGPMLIGLCGTLGTVVFSYAAMRGMKVGPSLALMAAASLALSPIVMYISFVPMSDAVSTAWCALALWAAIRSRASTRWALICGFAFAAAVLIRPTNILLGPPLALLLWHWRNLLCAALGGLPGALVHASYCTVLFGSPFKLGYGSLLEESFAWHFAGPSWQNYLKTLPYVLPLILPALVFAPWLPWKDRARELAAMFGAVAAFLVFYSYYNMTHLVWWYTRFLMPVFSAAVVLGALALQGVLKTRLSNSARAINGVALLGVLGLACSGMYWAKKHQIRLMKIFQEPYIQGGDWARANLPKEALVLSMQTSSSLYFYTDFPIFRVDVASREEASALLRATDASQRPVYAIIFPFEREEALREKFPGQWSKLATLIDLEVWRRDGPLLNAEFRD